VSRAHGDGVGTTLALSPSSGQRGRARVPPSCGGLASSPGWRFGWAFSKRSATPICCAALRTAAIGPALMWGAPLYWGFVSPRRR